MLLIAPGEGIVGGQTVQARRLLALLGTVAELEMRFQPINPPFPKPLCWLRRIPVLRTGCNMLLYLPQMLWKAARADVLHIFTAGLSSYTLWTIPAFVAGKLFGKKVVIHYHDGRAGEHLRQHWTAKPTLGWADVIVSPSAYVVDLFAGHGISARTIFNVIDSAQFHYRERRRLRPLLMTNRMLEPLYNVDCILRAFQRVSARYPEATLTIAHDGPLRRHLERQASELGLRNCRFLGCVPQEEIARRYEEADIYVMTPDIDCMPVSLLECMVSGLPIVATNVGGIPYMVKNEETALLVERNDHEAVARQVFRLLEDPDLVERLATNARREVERYRGDAIRGDWVALYRELMDNS